MGANLKIMKIRHVRFYFLLFIGIFISSLSACTPAPYHYIVVEKIVVEQDVIYIRASKECNFCENISGFVYYASQDNGQTWEEITSPTEDVLQKLEGKQNKQSTLCLSTDSQICYQITGEEQVEISNDGGATWQTDWQIPVGRKLYMERRFWGSNPDTVPFDMQIIESVGGYFVIVAMGNQGVLVKSPGGNWARYAVGLAEPISYQAASFKEAWNVINYSEQIVAILVGVGCLLLLSLAVWITIYINSSPRIRKQILISCLPTVFFAAASAFFLFINFRYLAFILTLLGFMITWLAIIVVLWNRFLGFLTLLLSLGFSILIYFCILFPFLLWAMGDIPVYETALVITYVVGVVAIFVAFIAEIRFTARSVRQINN